MQYIDTGEIQKPAEHMRDGNAETECMRDACYMLDAIVMGSSVAISGQDPYM